jgi:hypothetical protein
LSVDPDENEKYLASQAYKDTFNKPTSDLQKTDALISQLKVF